MLVYRVLVHKISILLRGALIQYLSFLSLGGKGNELKCALAYRYTCFAIIVFVLEFEENENNWVEMDIGVTSAADMGKYQTFIKLIH